MLTARLGFVVAAVCAFVAMTAPTAHATTAHATTGPAAAVVPLPTGVTAGIAVFDRQTNTFTEQLNTTVQFRSASVVKLLIALDYLWDRGPTYAIPAADRTQLDGMLRSSNDNAASTFWSRDGYEQVINRMVPRLALQNTAPPPASLRTFWGYTALTAADTVRIYRYILDSAPAPVRDYIMGNLRQSTRCAADGFDQSFGIPSAFAQPWAVKQGWSGFDGAQATCSAVSAVARQAAPADGGVDLVKEALHTTGTVGPGDRSIVAVFTLQPVGTAFATAARTLTDITRSLRVNGGVPVTGTWFRTWGTGVHVRATPSTSAAIAGTLPAGADVLVQCQKQGQEVVIDPYDNDWWAFLPQYGGYMTNIYVRSAANKLPIVPDC